MMLVPLHSVATLAFRSFGLRGNDNQKRNLSVIFRDTEAEIFCVLSCLTVSQPKVVKKRP